MSGTNSGIDEGATRMKNAVRAPRMSVTMKISVDASRNASRRLPRSSCSVKTGTNAAWIAASANRLRTRFGTWKAIVKADICAVTPKYEAATISRTSPATARARSPQRRARSSAPGGRARRVFLRLLVAAIRPRPAGHGLVDGLRPSLTAPLSSAVASWPTSPHNARATPAPCASGPRTGYFSSAVKTHFKRLEDAVASGDDAAADAEHRDLVSKIDKAVRKGALHRNSGARRKARAARIRAGSCSQATGLTAAGGSRDGERERDGSG